MAGATKTTSAIETVDRLRQDIVDGVFDPGARLVAADLARRYGTSAMPIRSALQILQVEGFVTYSPRQGASVRPLDANYVRQLYDVRVALTAMLLPSVVRHISMAHLEDAQMFLEEFRAHVKARRLAEAMRSNSSFHRTIYAVAGNQPAIEVLERTWMILDALRARVGFGEGRLEQSDEGHHRLLNALKERDAATAIAIATKYAESACADLSVRLEEDHTAPKN